MIDLIMGIFADLVSLVSKLYYLLGYIIAGVFFISLLYLLVVRPILGVANDKGKRLYWFSLIFLLVWGLAAGPLFMFWLLDVSGGFGFIVGMVIYIGVMIPIYKYSRKFEN